MYRNGNSKGLSVMEINDRNNTCSVFEIPEFVDAGALSASTYTAPFKLVDSFKAIHPLLDKVSHEEQWIRSLTTIEQYVKSSEFTEAGKKYLIVTGFQKSMIVEVTE